MPRFVSSVSPKGQITIPMEIRKRLGIKSKDKVAFEVEGDTVTLALSSSHSKPRLVL